MREFFERAQVLVIGGGAAGMMAATVAARSGADVLLLEKNDRLGKKLRITGKGRCNVTNDCDRSEFMSNVATNSKFLFAAWDLQCGMSHSCSYIYFLFWFIFYFITLVC